MKEENNKELVSFRDAFPDFPNDKFTSNVNRDFGVDFPLVPDEVLFVKPQWISKQTHWITATLDDSNQRSETWWGDENSAEPNAWKIDNSIYKGTKVNILIEFVDDDGSRKPCFHIFIPHGAHGANPNVWFEILGTDGDNVRKSDARVILVPQRTPPPGSG